MTNTICRDTSKLAPFFRERLELALAECKKQKLSVAVFEAYRSPERQDVLYAQGRINKKPIVTMAKGWQSWHQYGLAVDLAFKNGKSWTWEGPWSKVLAVFHDHGFESLSFEKSHVQITGKLTTKEAKKIVEEEGFLALWEKVREILVNS